MRVLLLNPDQRQALASSLLFGFAGAALSAAVVLFAVTPEPASPAPATVVSEVAR